MKQVTPISCKLFQGLEKEEVLLNPFYEASINLIPKHEDTIWKWKVEPDSFMNIAVKTPNQILTKHIQE